MNVHTAESGMIAEGKAARASPGSTGLAATVGSRLPSCTTFRNPCFMNPASSFVCAMVVRIQDAIFTLPANRLRRANELCNARHEGGPQESRSRGGSTILPWLLGLLHERSGPGQDDVDAVRVHAGRYRHHGGSMPRWPWKRRRHLELRLRDRMVQQ